MSTLLFIFIKLEEPSELLGHPVNADIFGHLSFCLLSFVYPSATAQLKPFLILGRGY